MRPRKMAAEKATNAIAASHSVAPSWSYRYSPDHVSIEPSTRNADRTTSAGSQRPGWRRNAVSENPESTSVAPRAGVPACAFQNAAR